MASTNRTPIGGSANWRNVSCPAMVNDPDSGTTEKARKAGSTDRYGASRKTGRSAESGIDCSLKNNLMPSASDWSNPNGPARLGPIRFCMSATTLRSSQIVISTVTSSRAKTNSALAMTISTTVRSTPLAKSGSPTDAHLNPHSGDDSGVDELGGRLQWYRRHSGGDGLVGAGQKRDRPAVRRHGQWRAGGCA